MIKNGKCQLPLLLVAAVTFALSSSAFAQIDTSRHFVTGTIDGQFFDFRNQLDDFGRAFNDRVSVGGRYQYNFNPRWGVEGNFLFGPGDTDLIGGSRDLGDTPLAGEVDDFDLQRVDIDAYYYTGSVVYNFLDNGTWTPYVVVGGGLVTLDVRNGAGVETRPVGTFGGGVVYAVRDRLGIRVDVRDYIYEATDFEPDTLNTLGLPTGFSQTMNDLSVTFGASILF